MMTRDVHTEYRFKVGKMFVSRLSNREVSFCESEIQAICITHDYEDGIGATEKAIFDTIVILEKHGFKPMVVRTTITTVSVRDKVETVFMTDGKINIRKVTGNE